MKQFFRDYNFRPDAMQRIAVCEQILDNYAAQNLRLTLRQLYYQLVTQNIITNEEKSYKSLGDLVSRARLAGLLDWDAIEDRVRVPRPPPEYENLKDLAEAALYSYRLPRWQDQDCYAELWVEKDALAGVLRPLALEHHVTLMVNRGYSSQSAMYEAANRFKEKCDPEAEVFHAPVLFYLGDHDPSGEDMVRDIRDRMTMFGVDDIRVEKIALTTAQVRQYNPPPNPAKITDPRAAKYIEEHGPTSWEVDALPPNVLAQIVRRAFRSIIDADKMQVWKDKEVKDKARLKIAVEQIMAEE